MADNVPLIQQINFSEGGVEVIYVEPRDVESFNSTGITRTRVVGCPVALVEVEIAEVLESARDLLEAIEIRERNPRYGK